MKKIITALVMIGITASMQAQNLTQLGLRTYGADLSDVWGYVDGSGNEYALVGVENGFSVVDVTTPASPNEVLFIPGPSSIWRDMNVWNDHAYVTTEGGGGVLIVDLSPLPAAVTNWTTYGGGANTAFQTVHNAIIDENGVLYIFGSDNGVGGALMFDLTIDPMNPVELGKWDQYYIHDGNVIGDTLWASCVNNGFMAAVDVSNKTNPQLLQTWNTSSNFTHNNWYNDDRSYIYTTDEVSNAYIDAFDISNLSNVIEVDRYQSEHSQGVIPHNTHFMNNFLITSYYRDGVTIVDVNNPANMVETGWFDSSPSFAGNGFNGCWGVYPWLPSGNVLASDMEEGLYILGPTYVQACYLDGQVTDQGSGNPINAATVDILTTSTSDMTDPVGDYATGVAIAGTYDVEYSAPGYYSDTAFSIALTNGNTVTQNIQLVSLPTFAMSGQVLDANTSNPIANADVRLQSGTFTFDLTTDAGGNFAVAAFYEDSYDVTAGNWGYITNCSNTYIDAANNTVTVLLTPGIYDDFTFDNSWVVTGDATAGIWERGEPIGTDFASVGDANPEFDVSNDCSDQAYSTGNGGGSAGTDDIDGGYTILTSPTIDLSGYADPYLYYSRWFMNDGGFGSPNDSLNVKINNGTTTVTIETVLENTANNSSWVDRSYQINSLITPTGTMTFIFEASDNFPGHLVEAALDHFRVTDYPEAVEEIAVNVDEASHISVYPNPSHETTTVVYSFENTNVGGQLVVRNSLGQAVSTTKLRQQQGNVELNSKLPQGLYFITLEGDSQHVETVRFIKL